MGSVLVEPLVDEESLLVEPPVVDELSVAGAPDVDSPLVVPPWSVVVGVSLGISVGVIAVAYPASRAARLDPITALRAE